MEKIVEVEICNQSTLRVAGWAVAAPTEEITSKIQELWAQAASARFPGEMPGQVRQNTATTLTTNWFGNGPATFLLGAEVRLDAPTPAGLVAQILPEARCAIFTLEGKIPNLIEDWDGIWTWLEKHGEEWTKRVSLRYYDYGKRTGSIALPLR